ncbi:hypothetical protein AAH991_37035 [Microbispora sp. ZYX-F-249]|uniref:Helix-turn-helix domain-containing protein n=1 Tax=Microbispora maris TaxID=3144104 RepID=A0ABV0B1K3_9ACTN
MTFITLRQAADRFDISLAALRKLAAAGLLPVAGHPGAAQVIPENVARRIAHRSHVTPRLLSTPARTNTIAVLRVDVAKPVPAEDRPYIGFHADLAPEHLLEALRGWWVGNPEKIARAGVLPVTLGGFVVAVLTGLGDWDSRSTGDGPIRHRFDARLAGYITDLDAPANAVRSGSPGDLRIAERVLGKRLTSNSGGPIAYLTFQSQSQT